MFLSSVGWVVIEFEIEMFRNGFARALTLLRTRAHAQGMDRIFEEQETLSDQAPPPCVHVACQKAKLVF